MLYLNKRMFTLIQNLNLVGLLYTCSFYFMLESYEFSDSLFDGYNKIGLLLLLSIVVNLVGFFLEKSSILAVPLNMLWGNVGLKLLFGSGETFSSLVGHFVRVRTEDEKLNKLKSWMSNDDLTLSSSEQLGLLRSSKNFDDLSVSYLQLKILKEEQVTEEVSSFFLTPLFNGVYNFATTHYYVTGAAVAIIGLGFYFYVGGVLGLVVSNINAQKDYLVKSDSLNKLLESNQSTLSDQVGSLGQAVHLLNERSDLNASATLNLKEQADALKSELARVEELAVVTSELVDSIAEVLCLDKDCIYNIYKLFSSTDEKDIDFLIKVIKSKNISNF